MSLKFVTILFIAQFYVDCVPVYITGSKNDNKDSTVISPATISFMQKYGYLYKGSLDSEALYHETAITEAIKNVQKYGALEQTGILDNDTLKLMSSPRCGVSDIVSEKNISSRNKRFVIGSNGWRKRKITYFIANWSPKIGKDKVSQDMLESFRIWSKYSNLKFTEMYDPSADIIIAFGSGYHGDRFPFDGPGNILAHAFYPYEMNSFGGDIHFDNDENWKENATNFLQGVHFQSVATHELGHSLGLAHSSDFSSIMFPYYKGPEESKELGYDDILAMYELYTRNGYDEPEESTNINFHTDETSTTKRSTNLQIVTKSTVNDDQTIPTLNTAVTLAFTSNSPAIEHNLCLGHANAIATLRGQVYVFKGEHVWQLENNFGVKPGYPTKFKEIFRGLPDYVTHIDAVYERLSDGHIVLFNGREYWVFNQDMVVNNSPKPITDFGFDTIISRIDAVFVWNKNNYTYIFSGVIFIRYNEADRTVDDSYPQKISERWLGIPNNIDAVSCFPNGDTYFFKGNLFWVYNNYWIRPRRGYPKRTSNIWSDCSSET